MSSASLLETKGKALFTPCNHIQNTWFKMKVVETQFATEFDLFKKLTIINHFQFMKIQVIIILLTVSRADRSRESISACDSANPFDFSSFGFALPLLSSFWLLLAPVIKTWKSLIVSFFFPTHFTYFLTYLEETKTVMIFQIQRLNEGRRIPQKTNTLKSAKYTSIKRFATFGPSPLFERRTWLKKFT